MHYCYRCYCLVTQSCPTLCNPMDCSLPGSSSVHGILQARILEWVAISFSRGSPRHRINLGLLRCSQLLYQTELREKPFKYY